MKKCITTYVFVIFVHIVVFGQTNNKANNEINGHLFTLTYSNNGQINDEIDEFYFFKGSYGPNDDVFTYKQSEYKLNFHYEYVTKKQFSFYGKFGYSDRKDSYEISNWTPANGNKKQNQINISIGAKINHQIGKFQFATGLEIPYYKISDYKEKFISNDPNLILHQTIHIDGGNVFGLNNISSIKVFITKNFFISTDLTFGILNFQLGGETNYMIDYQNPILYQNGLPYDVSYNKITISKLELYFGIGFKL